MRRIILLTSFFILLVSCNTDKDLSQDFITIGTFNIQWLGDGIDDQKTRTDNEIAEIANIIASTDVDILALQEIENQEALNKITKHLPNYKSYVSNLYNKQNVAVIYKNNIEITNINEYEPLMMDGRSRPGLAFTAKINNFEFDAMVVHLKSTSRYDSTAELKELSREMRKTQAEIISHWADSMMGKCGKMELAILGDFNDFPARKNNATLTPIIENPNLHFMTENERSCSNPLWLAIDHIVLSSTTKKRFREGSVFIYNFYSSLTDRETKQISDHCPISLQLSIN